MSTLTSTQGASATATKTATVGTAEHPASQAAKLSRAQREKVEDALCAAVANGATDKRIATVSLALVSALAALNVEAVDLEQVPNVPAQPSALGNVSYSAKNMSGTADIAGFMAVTPRWQSRVESACVALACGAGTGYRTKLTLMHPEVRGDDKSLFDAHVQKKAADVLYEVILSLVDLVPGLPAQIERRLADLALWREGTIDRGDRSLPPPAEGFPRRPPPTDEQLRMWKEACPDSGG